MNPLRALRPAWSWGGRTLEMQLAWLIVACLMALCAGAVTAIGRQLQGAAVLTQSTEVHSRQIEQLAMTGDGTRAVPITLSTQTSSSTSAWTTHWDGQRIWAQAPGPNGTPQRMFSVALSAPAASAPQWAAGWHCQAVASAGLGATDLPPVCR
jgi:hypothetical protein